MVLSAQCGHDLETCERCKRITEAIDSTIYQCVITDRVNNSAPGSETQVPRHKIRLGTSFALWGARVANFMSIVALRMYPMYTKAD
jgi:hypothetical protein